MEQYVPEGRAVALDGGHGVVDVTAYGGLVRLGLELRPAGLGRHPEDVLSDVFVAVLGGLFTPFGEQVSVALLEGVGDVLQEDQSKDDVLVLGGVHASTQGVGHLPELGLVAGRRLGGGQ